MRVDVRLLGPLEVSGAGTPVCWTGARRKAVFGLLALRAGRLVTRSALIDGLWGEDVPPTATKTLQGHVAQVRKSLACAGAGEMVVTRDPGYVLDVEGVRVDVQEFELHVRLGREAMAGRRFGTAAGCFAAALRLWRGDPLVDCPVAGWGCAEVARLKEALAGAEEQHAAALCSGGRYWEAIGELERLVALYPLRESLWELLMSAQHQVGRAADALCTYRRVRRLLIAEFGLEPGAALRRMEAAVLAG